MADPNRNTSPEEKENTDATMTVDGNETATSTSQTRTTEEVRQGHTGDHVRYILLFSSAGALIVLFLLIWLYFGG
jgi:hypothetical protein